MGDQQRFEQLLQKRTETGLSKEEANELGRLFAEREKKPYSNAEEAHAPARRSRLRALGVFRRMRRQRRSEGDRAA
jgi:hypothetical protein